MTDFPISENTPISYPGPLPERAEITVIGGGIIGVCTALSLAREGHNVLLLEKGRIAAEQSSRNWGWIRQQGRDLAELPIMMEANRLWHDLAAETNEDIGLRQCGVTYLAPSAQAMANYEAWIKDAAPYGVDSHLLSARQVAERYPGLAHSYHGALVTPSDLRAEPWVATPAIARIAARHGAQIMENCAVRGLERRAGRVSGVLTEHGTVKTDTVVLAGGAWSSLFLRNEGIDLPQLSVRASVLATQPLEDVGQGGAATDRKLAFRRRTDGGYTLAPPGAAHLFIGPDAFRHLRHYLTQLRADPFGQQFGLLAPRGFPDAWTTPRTWDANARSPFEEMRVLNPAPHPGQIRRLLRDFREMFPQLPEVQARMQWAGMIDTMPDIVPVVDHAPLPGLIVGTGMSGHGFGIGPAMGRILSALATGADAGFDLSRFRMSRFTDGSPIVLGPDV